MRSTPTPFNLSPHIATIVSPAQDVGWTVSTPYARPAVVYVPHPRKPLAGNADLLLQPKDDGFIRNMEL